MSAFVNSAIETLQDKPQSFPGTFSHSFMVLQPRAKLQELFPSTEPVPVPVAERWVSSSSQAEECCNGGADLVGGRGESFDEDFASVSSARLPSSSWGGRSDGQTADFYDAEDALREDESMSEVSTGDRSRGLEWRLKLEIANRVRAEEALEAMRLQREAMAEQVQKQEEEKARHAVEEEHEQQELLVARVVSAAVASGCARAEMSAELKEAVARKDREIAQLREKLQYWERVHREMMEHREEAKEAARVRRKAKERRRALLVNGVGAAMLLGLASAAAYLTWRWSDAPTVLETSQGVAMETEISPER